MKTIKQFNNEAMEGLHFESLYPDDSRFAEIEKILGFIKGGKSCQIVSLPGTGRSNLLRLLAYNRNVRIKHSGEDQKWLHFVYMNFSEVKNRSLFDVLKFMFLSLADSLRDRKLNAEHEALHKIFKSHMIQNDEIVLFQGLKEAVNFLSIEKELAVVFLFDRFEDYISKVSDQFFINLKTLRNIAKYRFSVIFSLPRPLEDLIEPALFADFYEFIAGNIIYLSLYDKPGTDFRISYLQKISGKDIDIKLLDKIIDLTGGHGKLTRLCAESILADKDLQPNAKKLIEFLLEQKPVQKGLFEIWSSFIPAEQEYLISNISSTVFNIEKENIIYLEKVGMLKNQQIAIPIFEEYIKTLKETAHEQIHYDQDAREIKKGELVLSENLTSAEFRLLKYLIENQGKIIEREEIINSVWKDTQTTAGVTDQALDQLIFRLRKKIETDPNNPKHLETIKGRGMKFTA
ncbi:MAG: helix-turn-helix domain-containing protein [Patescibacteria group bacterium]|nr:helix-turn-helix domain-containing protein [Patescibacteria group bacterium]